MQERLKKIQEEKAESFKKAQEEAFQRDLETFKEKADKNGEWMTRIRVSACLYDFVYRLKSRRSRRSSCPSRSGSDGMMRTVPRGSSSISRVSALTPTA